MNTWFARNEERTWLFAQPVGTMQGARVECQRIISNAPSAIEGRSRWLAQRVQVGRMWKVPRIEEGL
jgi:hypothetical protein